MTDREDRPRRDGQVVNVGSVSGGTVTIAETVHQYLGAQQEKEERPPLPLRVLLLGSSPFDIGLGRIRADREFRAIRDVAGEGILQLAAWPAATAADLKVVLAAPRPDVMHLCCHGDGTTMLFETPEGAPHPVPVDRVVQRLTRYHDEAGLRLRCIVLAMCDGAVAAPRFAPLADTVVAWDGEIDDRCGVRFAAEFYSAAAHRTVPTFGAAARLAAEEVWADDTLPCTDVRQQLFVVGP